jgi:hypothetical protein
LIVNKYNRNAAVASIASPARQLSPDPNQAFHSTRGVPVEGESNTPILTRKISIRTQHLIVALPVSLVEKRPPTVSLNLRSLPAGAKSALAWEVCMENPC